MAKKYVVNGAATGSLGFMGKIYFEGELFPSELASEDMIKSLLSEKLLIELAPEKPAAKLEDKPAKG